jgi:hypothetical protein
LIFVFSIIFRPLQKSKKGFLIGLSFLVGINGLFLLLGNLIDSR